MELKLSINPSYTGDGVRGQSTEECIELFLNNIFWDCNLDVDKLPEGINHIYLIELICREFIVEIMNGAVVPACFVREHCPIAKMLKNAGFIYDARKPDGELFEI